MSSSDSDLEDLINLSDWTDTDSDEVCREYKIRIDHFNNLDAYEFQIRFRLDKPSVERLLTEVYPHLRVKGTRFANWRRIQKSERLFLTERTGCMQCRFDFQNIVARWPGSSHDATIFNNSELRAQCEGGMYGNKWLLGDSAYPLKPYLLTPLLNPQTRAEQLYNEAHIRTRNCIERCFGVWKRRFPVVALTMRLSLLRANAVIIATAILHNICRMNSLNDIPPEVEIPTPDAIPAENFVNESQYTERTTLISEFFNNLT